MSTNQASASAAPVESVVSKSPADKSASTDKSASYDVQVSFYAFRNGQAVPLTQGSRVRLGDKLFAHVNASRSVHLYIVNRDDTGQSFLLFPLPGFSPGNPIPISQMTRFPGTSDGLQHYWNVTSAGGREHFFLYVSPQRLVEFEQLLAALPRAEVGRTVTSIPLSTSDIGILRSIGGLSAAASSTTPAAGTELADLQPLSDQTESATGVWARRMTLQNPAK
jgi:hypothetical protein